MSSSDSESDLIERWCRVLMDKTPVDVPASFIEGYHSEMELVKNRIYNVFWSPNDEDTPESIRKSKDRGPIVHVNKLAKKPSIPIMGWYQSVLLAVGDSYEQLEEELDKKRVTRPTAKVVSQVQGKKSRQSQQDKSVKISSEKPIRKEQHKSEMNRTTGNKKISLKEKLAAAKKHNILAVMKSFGMTEVDDSSSSEKNNTTQDDQGNSNNNLPAINKDQANEDQSIEGQSVFYPENPLNSNQGNQSDMSASNKKHSNAHENTKNKTDLELMEGQMSDDGSSSSERDSTATSATSDVPLSVYQNLKDKYEAAMNKIGKFEAKVCALKSQIEDMKEGSRKLELELKTCQEKSAAILELNVNLQLEVAELKKKHVQMPQVTRKSSSQGLSIKSSRLSNHNDQKLGEGSDNTLVLTPTYSKQSGGKEKALDKKSVSAGDSGLDFSDFVSAAYPVTPTQKTHLKTTDSDVSAKSRSLQILAEISPNSNDDLISPGRITPETPMGSTKKVNQKTLKRKLSDGEDNCFCLQSEEELRNTMSKPSFSYGFRRSYCVSHTCWHCIYDQQTPPVFIDELSMEVHGSLRVNVSYAWVNEFFLSMLMMTF